MATSPPLPDLLPTVEASELAAVTRALVERHLPPGALHAWMERSEYFHGELWGELAGPLEPVAAGEGSRPLHMVELATAAEQLGGAAAPTPLLGIVLATATLSAVIDPVTPVPAADRLLWDRSTLALFEDDLDLGPWDRLRTRAEPAGASWRLTGTKRAVVDAPSARFLVVAARLGEEPAVLVAEADDRSTTVIPRAGLDLTRSWGEVAFDGTPARLVAVGPPATAAVDSALDVGATLLAAEAVGGAQRCLDLTVEHLGRRHQFGRPVGSFQALKHRCAELMVQIELARSTATAASWVADHAPDQLPISAPVARVACSQAYLEAAKEAIQLHGARAMTWDHEIHLHLKRARAASLAIGSADRWNRTLGDRLDL